MSFKWPSEIHLCIILRAKANLVSCPYGGACVKNSALNMKNTSTEQHALCDLIKKVL